MQLPGGKRAILVLDQGSVTIDDVDTGEQMIRWLHILESRWVSEPLVATTPLTLSPPGPGMWIALVE